MISSATHGDGGQGQRQVREDLEQQAAPHQRGEANAPLEPAVEERADHARRAPTAVVSRPKPTSPMCSRSRE